MGKVQGLLVKLVGTGGTGNSNQGGFVGCMVDR